MSWRGVLLLVIATPTLWFGGCKKEEDFGLLDARDFSVPDGGGPTFNANDVLSTETMTDALSVDAARIHKFFSRTPYDRPSFLETYSSNGVRAEDAIVRSARYHQINPIVLLVRAQTDQGLIGARDYPFPTDRVEFAFRCGCAGRGACDGRLAGFDKQVDCLAAQLRTALNEIADQGHTSGGWAPGTERTSLDGVLVNPANEATAALYQVLPFVADGRAGGNWLFANVYRLYGDALGYFGSGAP